MGQFAVLKWIMRNRAALPAGLAGYAMRTDAFPIEVDWSAVPELPDDADEDATSDLL